jgi:membrane protein
MFTKDENQVTNQVTNQDRNGDRNGDGPESTETSSEAETSEIGFENRPDYTKGPKRSAFFVLKMTVREFQADGGTDLAAALTYYSVLAIFPGLLALLSLVGIFGQADEAVDKIFEVLTPLVSSDVIDMIDGPLNALASSQSAGLALVIGVLGALWSASGYVGAFSRAMNRIYEVEEGRPFWRMRPMQLGLTVITVVLCAVALAILIVSGPVAESVGKSIGVGDDLVTVWGYAKWPVLAIIVMVLVALLYHATPNVDFVKFRVISVGAFVAILMWLVASIGFAYYVANFSSYNKTYGSIAGVIVALLWLWITNLALLFGGELDAELERGRELQLGLAAEEKLQLPMRDTRNVDKAASRRTKDIEKMRQIRLAATAPGDPADRPYGRH